VYPHRSHSRPNAIADLRASCSTTQIAPYWFSDRYQAVYVVAGCPPRSRDGHDSINIFNMLMTKSRRGVGRQDARQRTRPRLAAGPACDATYSVLRGVRRRRAG
jgi:hypothetical protein